MTNSATLFRPTEYFRPGNIPEAIELIKHYSKGRFLAGGTDLLVERDAQIKAIIDIGGLGLDYIILQRTGIKIGAMVTFANIEASPFLAEEPYDVLAQSARQMGTPQIRNAATIGGNICSAVPSADSAPALLVLDATLKISGPEGDRLISIDNFFRSVRRNALKRNEILVEIQVPHLPRRTRAVFMKKGRTATGDLAVVSVAVRITLTSNNICKDVRIALGAVAPTPLRAKKAEKMLEGKKPEGELIKMVADCAAKEIEPISDVRGSAKYRRTLSQVLVERAQREVIAKLRA